MNIKRCLLSLFTLALLCFSVTITVSASFDIDFDYLHELHGTTAEELHFKVLEMPGVSGSELDLSSVPFQHGVATVIYTDEFMLSQLISEAIELSDLSFKQISDLLILTYSVLLCFGLMQMAEQTGGFNRITLFVRPADAH